MNKKTYLKNLFRKIQLWGVDYEKLHLGSGAVILEGWLNIDFDTSFGEGVYPIDLRNPLPFPDKSVSMIFSEHLIEHLPKDDGLKLLQECYRVLKPGGKMRFGWPDFNKVINAFIKKDKKFRKGMLKHMGLNRTQSWDEFIADMLFSWDHRYYYTPKLLKEYMRIAGFSNIKQKGFAKSNLGFVWDTRNDPDTSYLEAKK